MIMDKIEDNGKDKNQKDNTNSKYDDSNYIIEERERFYGEENISPEVKGILDEVFSDIVSEDIESENKSDSDISNINNIDNESQIIDIEHSGFEEPVIETNDMVLSTEINPINAETSNEIEDHSQIKEGDSSEKIVELKEDYESKLKEYKEKDDEYNRRYAKLENTIQEYKDRNHKLLEKRKEYESTIKEFEKKSGDLEITKEELKTRNEKLKEAREQFTQLSKHVEEKKIDFEKKEKKLEKSYRSVEKIRFELEKSKIEFEKNKLEFEIAKSETEIREKELDIIEPSHKLEDTKDFKIPIEEKRKPEGKKELLEVILHKLSEEGYFQSCFLIDSKGMLISEYSQNELDKMAVGAMFSLMGTSVLRTVDSLKLQELLYFKLASVNGEFLLKNINISNYNRKFILISFYNKSDSTYPNITNKINKKVIKKILKSIKSDFYEFLEESKISWAFDNLVEKITFLKEKYKMPESDLELIRGDKLDKAVIEIKELFEM